MKYQHHTKWTSLSRDMPDIPLMCMIIIYRACKIHNYFSTAPASKHDETKAKKL